MKKCFLLPTMAVAAVLMLNSCELFCEQYAELCCETECPEEITSIMVSLQPFTVPGTRATEGGQTKSVTAEDGNQSFSQGDKISVTQGGVVSTWVATESRNPAPFVLVEGKGIDPNIPATVQAPVGRSGADKHGKKVYLFETDNRESSEYIDCTPALPKEGNYNEATNSADLVNLGGAITTAVKSDVSLEVSCIKVVPEGMYPIEIQGTLSVGNDEQKMILPAPAKDGDTRTKVSYVFEYSTADSLERFVTFTDEFEASNNAITKEHAIIITDNRPYQNLNWNKNAKTYNYPSTFNIPAREASYCFDGNFNDEGKPILPSRVEMSPLTKNVVVADVTLTSAGFVTFTSTGRYGTARITVYDSDDKWLARWTIVANP